MGLPQLIIYGFVFIAFSSTSHAEIALGTEISQQLVTAQQRLTEMQAQLEQARQNLQIFQEDVAQQETTQRVTILLLEAAEQENEQVQTHSTELRAQHQTIESQWLEKQQALKQQQQALTELIQNTAQTTDVEQQIVALENSINLQTKLLELQEKQVKTLNEHRVVVDEHLKLVNKWRDKLQGHYRMAPVLERQQTIQKAQQRLEKEQQALKKRQIDLPDKITSLGVISTTDLVDLLEKALLDKKAAELEVDNLRLEQQSTATELERQLGSLKERQNALEILQKTLDPSQAKVQRKQITELEGEVEVQKKLIDLEKKQLEVLKERADLAHQRLSLETSWHAALQNVHQMRKKQNLESQIQSRKAPYLIRAAELRKQLEELQNPAQRYLLEIQIQEAEERAQQVIYRLKLEHIQEQLTQIPLVIDEKSIKFYRDIQNAIREFRELQAFLTERIAVLRQTQEVIAKRSETLQGEALSFNEQANALLADLITQWQQDSTQGSTALAQLENAHKEYQRRLLLSQRRLPQDTAGWKALAQEASALPHLFLRQLYIIGDNFAQAVLQLSVQRQLLAGMSILIWSGLFFWMRSRLQHIFTMLKNVTVRSFVVNSLLLGLQLLHRNAIYIWITGILLLLIVWAEVMSASFIVLVTVLLAILGVKFLINLTWLLLKNKTLKVQYRSKLYRQLYWTLIFTGGMIVFTVLMHVEIEGYELSVSATLRDLGDSLFMLFLSLMVLPTMRIRSMVLTSLEENIRIKKYWWLVIRLLSLLLPLAILTVALLGVIGYIQLGWKIAEHASLFLLVLTGWLVTQGLLDDTVTLSKNFAIKHSQYGLLWTQDIIPLIHKLFNIALLGLAILAFLWINGWYTDAGIRDAAVKESLDKLLTYPLLILGNTQINLGNLLLSILILWAVFWFGSWCRRVTYRWIYINVVDLGIRNSLSVFTQYIVVLIGLLITLRIIGIDLTTLAVFAGALGVGIGFGLQNIANNFISGILLLIERPLRTGDIVNISGLYEGVVKEMGIRSLTVQTWNHEEVIVPNAELISHAFTNWTHSDKNKRTTLIIGASYDDDPNQVQTVLIQALQEIPNLLSDPPPQVILWEFANSSVNFRVDYFINLSESSFLKTKGAVLLAIWNRFKAAGIQIPYPQQDIYVKSFTSLDSQVS